MSDDSQAVHTLHIQKEVQIAAPIEIVFQSILDEQGPNNRAPDGSDLKLRIEPWPGGRWYRDLGDNAGHLWGHVQVIKPPTLLEICGPLFMSYAAVSHVQYKLTPAAGGTRLVLTHRAIGQITSEHREGVSHGWESMLARLKTAVEQARLR